MPNLTDELSMAKERRPNLFGMAVLIGAAKAFEVAKVRSFVELNLASTHGMQSESGVTPVSLQS